jgi:arabinan endo-1,5-alpha-L-arabinosidase
MVVRTSSPRYLLFSTPNNQTRVSDDGVSFNGPVTTQAPAAWWVTGEWQNSYVWAPDVSYHEGKYWMYYALSKTFGGHEVAIGLATSLTGLPGTWTDQGQVLASHNAPGGGPETGDRYRALDPSLLVDTQNNWWLVFGSFWDGIFITPINPATGKPTTAPAALTNIAARSGPVQWDRPIEAPFIFRHNGWYYLFASFDYCCQGVSSTYNIRVGRSRSPTGPYLDKAGVDMRSGGGSMVLETHGWVHGPGGQSVVHDLYQDEDLLVYHYYDGRASGQPALGLNSLAWDAADWPYVW